MAGTNDFESSMVKSAPPARLDSHFATAISAFEELFVTLSRNTTCVKRAASFCSALAVSTAYSVPPAAALAAPNRARPSAAVGSLAFVPVVTMGERFVSAWKIRAPSGPGGPLGPSGPCAPGSPTGPGRPSGHALNNAITAAAVNVAHGFTRPPAAPSRSARVPSTADNVSNLGDVTQGGRGIPANHGLPGR